MTNESIPVGLQSLLVKHYFLSQIKSGNKPLISNMTFVESNSWTGWFFRSWHNETRYTCMSDIDKIIDETIDIIKIHKNNKKFLMLVINALSETRIGIQTMLYTYCNDPKIKGRIKVQLDNIDLQLDKYRDLITSFNIDEDVNKK